MSVLSSEQIEQFVESGYVKVGGCFDRAWADAVKRAACERLFCSLDDPSSWPHGRMRAPKSTDFDTRAVAPRAWEAACELLGGVDRVDAPWNWTDSFIVNFGRDEGLAWSPPGPEVLPHQKWHTDGDFFRHFLDSPEQGLLVLVCFSDIADRGGATQLACDSVGHVARYLAERPEGVLLHEIPADEIVPACSSFAIASGEVGDVFFMNPLILHTWAVNELDTARFIINPPVALREPMCFDRADGAYSPVERGILRSLGVDRLDYRPTGQRGEVVPERIAREQREYDDRRAAIMGG